MTFGDFKDLPRRTATDKILCDKGLSIAKNPKILWISKRFRWFINFLIKSPLPRTNKCSDGSIKNDNNLNQELDEELHKSVIRKFEKQKANSSFINNIWGAVLANMQRINIFMKGTCFLLSVIDIYSKYAWVVALKLKKVLQLIMLY